MIRPDRTPTPVLDRFVAPARRHPQLWRLLAGLLIALLVYVLWVVALLGSVWWGLGLTRDPIWLDRIVAAATPAAMLILLATFGGMMLAPMVAARLLQRRRAGTLFGPAPRVLRHFVAAASLVGLLLTLALAGWALGYDAVPNLPLASWLGWLPLAVVAVALQTGAEEVLFRGYLLQQLAARFRSPVLWMGLPALVFGLMHFDPITSGTNAWLVVASAALFGLLSADLTVRTGSLGASWGFHFANNAMALLVLATDGTLTGLSLFVTPYAASDAEALSWLIPIDLAIMVLAWLMLRRVLAR